MPVDEIEQRAFGDRCGAGTSPASDFIKLLAFMRRRIVSIVSLWRVVLGGASVCVKRGAL